MCIRDSFYQDVSDKVKTKTFFEDPHTSAGKDVMLDIVEKALRVCLSPAQEGQKFSFANTQDNWRLVRKHEEILSWGRYNFSNHCCSAFLTTTIIPEHQGVKQFEFLTDAHTIIGLNGKIIFDSENCLPIESLKFGYGYLHKFQLNENLLPSLNSLVVTLFRIGRTSSVNFSIKCNDKLEVSIPLLERMTTDLRKQIEEEISTIRFELSLIHI